MRFAVLLLAVVVAVSAAPQERLISDTIGGWFNTVWNNARNEFNRLTGGNHINFNDVVQRLIPLIDSGITNAACDAICIAAAGHVLGPAAPLAGTVCTPVCKAALARLEQAAG